MLASVKAGKAPKGIKVRDLAEAIQSLRQRVRRHDTAGAHRVSSEGSYCLEEPKLTAVATAELDGKSFGELLDKAIERQERAKRPAPKMIDVTPHPASELQGNFPRMKRRV